MAYTVESSIYTLNVKMIIYSPQQSKVDWTKYHQLIYNEEKLFKA